MKLLIHLCLVSVLFVPSVIGETITKEQYEKQLEQHLTTTLNQTKLTAGYKFTFEHEYKVGTPASDEPSFKCKIIPKEKKGTCVVITYFTIEPTTPPDPDCWGCKREPVRLKSRPHPVLSP